VIALGLLLVLVGFALMVPRGSVPGSASARNVQVGWMRIFNTRGYGDIPSWKYRLIQILMGLVVMGGGIVLIAVSS
jgi:hypothetical protein